MADGRITGRLIRYNHFNHKGQATGTAYLTLVKTRGSYRTASGEMKQADSDFLTFEIYNNASDSSKNRLKLLEKLATDNTLVEIEYNLKSTSYNDANGDRIFKEYKQLAAFEILESKQAVTDRLKLKGQSPKEDEEEITEEVEEFDPDLAGDFIQSEVDEHLKKSESETTDDGKYGNPFQPK